MTAFTVEQTVLLQLVRTSPLTEMYTLSPFVWRGRLRYELLLRAVNYSKHHHVRRLEALDCEVSLTPKAA